MSQCPETDKQGFLLDLDQWDEAYANKTAEEEGIHLTAEHWEIILILRDFYFEYNLRKSHLN